VSEKKKDLIGVLDWRMRCHCLRLLQKVLHQGVLPSLSNYFLHVDCLQDGKKRHRLLWARETSRSGWRMQQVPDQ
jgi:hypothetical protein